MKSIKTAIAMSAIAGYRMVCSLTLSADHAWLFAVDQSSRFSSARRSRSLHEILSAFNWTD